MSASTTIFNTPTKNLIHAYVLDYDGCCDQIAFGLFNPEHPWVEPLQPTWLTQFYDNCYLVQQIKNSANECEQVILLNGSARQDLYTDMFNRSTNFHVNNIDSGSCFYFLDLLENKLHQVELLKKKVILDRFLLPDALNSQTNTRPGETFNAAMKEEATTKLYHQESKTLKKILLEYAKTKNSDNTFLDEFKVAKLYLQIHRLASQNPSKHIVFNFYDDRLDICQNLSVPYKTNPALIPNNVTVKIHQYLPHFQKLETPASIIAIIQGTGKCDHHYINNAKELLKHLHQDTALNQHHSDIAHQRTSAISKDKLTAKIIKAIKEDSQLEKTKDGMANFAIAVMKIPKTRAATPFWNSKNPDNTDGEILRKLNETVMNATYTYHKSIESHMEPQSLDEDINPSPPEVLNAFAFEKTLARCKNLSDAMPVLVDKLSNNIEDQSFNAHLLDSIKANKQLLNYIAAKADATREEMRNAIVEKYNRSMQNNRAPTLFS